MPLKTESLEAPVLNLTPMIDVLFLLIIFFMVGTQFVGGERHIDIQVPSVAESSAAVAQPERRVVVLRAGGAVEVDGQSVTLEQLESHLAAGSAESRSRGVVILGDRSGSLQNLADVLQVCRKAGIRDIGLGVKEDRSRR